MKSGKKTLHPILWLWIPIAMIIAQIGIEVFTPKQYLPAMHSEGGPHETLQFIFMTLAFFVALITLITLMRHSGEGRNLINRQTDPAFKRDDVCWLTAWVGIAALASLYVAGEEVSWGQHIFDWGTPEFWQGINDQNETNLHNTSSWLDQKPRLILLIGTIVGGLIIPALAKWKPSALPEQFTIIYPPAILSLTAAFALLIKIIDKAQDHLDDNLFTRIAEIEELYLYYFVLLYLVVLFKRTKTLSSRA